VAERPGEEEEELVMRRRRCSLGCFFLPAGQYFQEVAWRPAADIYRIHRGWLAKFDLPGVRPEDIEVGVRHRRLSIQGVRRDWLEEEGLHHYSLEISYSPFERQIEFPESLEQAEIETEYRAGMLLVRILRKEERP
jgi:HSP20 family protein